MVGTACSADAAAAIVATLEAITGRNALAEPVTRADQRICAIAAAPAATVVAAGGPFAIGQAHAGAEVTNVGGGTVTAAATAAIVPALHVGACRQALADPVDGAALVPRAFAADPSTAVVPTRAPFALGLTDRQLAEAGRRADIGGDALAAAPSTQVISTSALLAGRLTRALLQDIEERCQLRGLAFVQRDAGRHCRSLDHPKTHQLDHPPEVLDAVVIRQLRCSIPRDSGQRRRVTAETRGFDHSLDRLVGAVHDAVHIGSVRGDIIVSIGLSDIGRCRISDVLRGVELWLTDVGRDILSGCGVGCGRLIRATAGGEQGEQDDDRQVSSRHRVRIERGRDSDSDRAASPSQTHSARAASGAAVDATGRALTRRHARAAFLASRWPGAAILGRFP